MRKYPISELQEPVTNTLPCASKKSSLTIIVLRFADQRKGRGREGEKERNLTKNK